MNVQKEKHAYLIMAHHRPDVLQALLEALDDERNDIFLHIDKKSDVKMREYSYCVTHSCLIRIPAMSVNWGGYSQIACELRLLEAAVSNGPYAYYHLCTGASYPLRTQDEIHVFFQQHAGTEFVDCDRKKWTERLRYIHVFSEAGKLEKLSRAKRAPIYVMRKTFLDLQKVVRYDHFRKFHMEDKKGFAYWSITHELAEYVLANKKRIRKMTKYSVCGDEMFLQTLVWNSPFRERLYNYSEEAGTAGVKWCSTWPMVDRGQMREELCFIREDLAYLQSSDALFALKFDGPDGMWLIEQIKKRNRTGKNTQ